MKLKFIKVALAGNPNVGKSVIFNKLTGARQHIGNWPGKTIDKKEGFHRVDGRELYIVDLPGTYSLTAFSVEEVIARDYIIYEKPDVVVDIVDASNLERNLYLTLQLIELGVNIVIALNKMDLARKEKIEINVDELSKELKVPVVPTIAPKGYGLDRLVREIVNMAESRVRPEYIEYPGVEDYIRELSKYIENTELARVFNPRWLAIKLLENDEDVIKKISGFEDSKYILEKAGEIRKRMEERFGDAEVAIANARYEVIRRIISKTVKAVRKITASDLIDQAVLDRYLGIPILFVILWWMFQFAFTISAPFSDFLGDLFAYIAGILAGLTGYPYIDYLFFGDYGIIQGLGAVLSFVPLIMALFFVLALFEDSGYMARAAFVMDRPLRKLGLSGRAIIPMIIGIGCNVPAVYSARVIPDERDRLIAIITNPFIMCSARLVFFSAIAYAFFREYAGDVILSLYLLGYLLVFVTAIILKKTIFRGVEAPFIIEFPAYQKPSFRVAVVRMWDRASLFFRKAGTIILIGLLVIGILAITDVSTLSFTSNPENSLVALIGRSLQPLFKPLNWDWRLIVAAIFGFVAKEIVLGANAMLYGVSESEIAVKMSKLYTPIDVLGYMIFIQLYIPCIATLAAVRHESGSWKWTLFTVLYGIAIAYILNFIVVSVGHLVFG